MTLKLRQAILFFPFFLLILTQPLLSKAQSPSISSFFPTSASSGQTVNIRGSNLSNVTAVNFGGVSAASFQILVDSTFYISAVVGAGASGSISVTNPSGTGSKTGFTYVGNPPVISSFFPLSASTGQTVTIRGSKLSDATAVSFGGVPAASFQILFDTTNYITAVVAGGASGSVSVTSPGGTGSKTGFTYVSNTPVISSFFPVSASTGQTVTIRGSKLSDATAVSFGSVPAASFQILFDTTNYITAVVAGGASGSVSVTNPSGTGSKTGFTYVSNAPVISSFFPVSASTGQTVTIRGSKLSDATAVSFGGVPAASFQILFDTTNYITAVVAGGASGSVSVTNPGGTGSKTGFTYVSNAPVISSFFPVSASTGQTVTIRGSKLSDATAVSFGGVAAASFQILFDTTSYITAVVAGGASGSVSVTSPGGTGSKTGFTYVSNAPVISSFFPVSATSGQTVTIRGSKLSDATAVSFGGVPAASFQILFDTTSYITAVVAVGASGSVSVTSPGGTGSKTGFTYVSTNPIIESFFPLSGNPGIIVRINGKNLNNVTSVNFGGTPAASFTINFDTAYYISAVVGNGTTGNISVSKSSATSISSGIFTLISQNNDTLSICPNSSITLTSSVTGSSYQWQINTDTGYSNLSNFGPFSGVQTLNLQMTNIGTVYNGSEFRCKVDGTTFSKTTVLKFISIWTGGTSSAWENTANWGCGQLPDSNTDVIIYNGPIILNNTTTVNSITLKPGVAVTVTSGSELIIDGK